jgi:putative SOS response-associated peptidase YedK
MKSMCGRFALYSSLAEIKKLFRIDTLAGDPAASYNIAPVHDVFAIISRDDRQRRRCAIPADGFYEWQKIKNFKQPCYLTPSAGSPFAFAGLWDTWKGGGGAVYSSCTIITTEASPQVSRIHNRMPVILKPDSVDVWLDAEMQDTARLENILQQGHETIFIIRPVSSYVNSPKNNDEKCLAEIS